MTDLKPCPFCGEEYLIDYGIMGGTMEGFDYVQCVNCGAEIHSVHNGNHIEAVEAWNMRAETVKDQPDGDVVEVVRCKDCKHLMFSDCYGECKRNHLGIVRPDDFCSFGERKEDDDNG